MTVTPEIEQRLELAREVEHLMDNPIFKQVILHHYIEETAREVGSDFDAGQDQIDALKAVTHLKRWLETVINDGKAIKAELDTNQY